METIFLAGSGHLSDQPDRQMGSISICPIELCSAVDKKQMETVKVDMNKIGCKATQLKKIPIKPGWNSGKYFY